VCRKVARKVVKAGAKQKGEITAENIHEFLGVAKFRDSEVHEKSEVGLVTGLAWTEVGGAIEARLLDSLPQPRDRFYEDDKDARVRALLSINLRALEKQAKRRGVRRE